MDTFIVDKITQNIIKNYTLGGVLMSLPILTATIRDNGIIKSIDLKDMTKGLYYKCRDILFCPNEDCTARIEFASGSKRTYFRTKRSKVEGEKIIEQHIEGCLYSVEHEKEFGTRGRYDPSIMVRITDKHLNDVLNRAYRNYKNSVNKTKGGDINNNGSRTKSRQSKKDDSFVSRGRAILSDLPEDLDTPEKQPPLYQKDINDIAQIDYGQIRTVHGIMQDFIIEKNYKYITLNTTDGRKGRILFGELYQNINETQYNQIDIYRKYLEEQSQKGEQVFVVCVGEIVRDDFDISVVMYKYNGIKIDGNSHYELLRRG